MELAPAIRSERGKWVAVQLLAPLAPHLAEELWFRLGRPFSVHNSAWPTPRAGSERSGELDLVVQVDGRVRGRLRIGPETPESEVVSRACALTGVEKPSRVVSVPGRLVNLVT
ncbi:MAG: class I tRNA ligase family protein [Acidimicrobiales bacterium]